MQLLMSPCLISMGNLGDVKMAMKDQGVKKVAAYSWVESNSKLTSA